MLCTFINQYVLCKVMAFRFQKMRPLQGFASTACPQNSSKQHWGTPTESLWFSFAVSLPKCCIISLLGERSISFTTMGRSSILHKGIFYSWLAEAKKWVCSAFGELVVSMSLWFMLYGNYFLVLWIKPINHHRLDYLVDAISTLFSVFHYVRIFFHLLAFGVAENQ